LRFEKRVGSKIVAERFRAALDVAARYPGADGETAHERREHRAGGRDRVSQLEGEEASPGDLVYEPGGTGQHVDDEKRPPPEGHETREVY
jgi:hypothetical protein